MMKKQPVHSTFLLGIFLTDSPVVADDAKEHPTRQHANAELIRRVTAPSSPSASATEGASATTVGTNQPSRTLFTNALPPLPPLPPGVAELKFNELFRPPIGPRGLEYAKKLRSLEGPRWRRIRI